MKLPNVFNSNVMNSIRIKFSIWVIVVMVLIFTIFAVILIQNNMKVTRARVTSEAESFAELSTKPLTETYKLYYDSGYYKFKEVTQKILGLTPVIRKYQIIEASSGNIVFDSEDLKAEVAPQNVMHTQQISSNYMEAVTGQDKVDYFISGRKDQLQMIIFPYLDDDLQHEYTIAYYVSYDLVKKNAAGVANIIIFLTIVFTLFSIATMYSSISRTIVSPLEIVQRGAEKISAGDYKFQVKINTNDEIEKLADSTNHMAKTLAADIDKLKHLDVLKDEFISLAAHNLRTPVVHIRYDIDFLLKNGQGKLSEKQTNVLQDINTSNENLATLVEDLLNLTTLEKEGMRLVKFSPVDLIAVTQKVVDNYQKKAQEKQLQINMEFGNLVRAEILGDQAKIQEVISNIYDNATKFNKQNGSVWIRLAEDKNDFIISIKDTGIGIKKEEVDELFKKFHRGTSYLTYEYSGTGLGLYIAKMIVDAHNGKIWVESSEGQGSTFYISFPKKTESSPLPKTSYEIK